MNHFVDIRGGAFEYDNLEKVHPACAALGDWVINWEAASVFKVELLAIERAKAEKDAENERQNQIKLDLIAKQAEENKAREKAERNVIKEKQKAAEIQE